MTTSRWDLFIAYTSSDRHHAEKLSQAIGQKLRVFLDYQSLKPGDDFDLVTPLAQREARGTAVLISESFTGSLYARAEAAAALALMRVNPGYKVLAIYLKGIPPVYDMPYGLNVTQAIDFHHAGDWNLVAEQIVAGLNGLPSSRQSGSHSGPVSVDPNVRLLRSLPRGPMVKPFLVRRSLIQSYAELIPAQESTSIINEAVYTRLSADPDATFVQPYHLPVPGIVAPIIYWTEAFNEACRHGPRMLAALLLAVKDDQFARPVQEQRTELLQKLNSWGT
jgi:hypothetical protein